MDTAKVFWSGHSQAVRLPKAFRFKSEAVRVRRHGKAIILEPLDDNWHWLDSLAHPLDIDFIQAATEQVTLQGRAELDELFQ